MTIKNTVQVVTLAKRIRKALSVYPNTTFIGIQSNTPMQGYDVQGKKCSGSIVNIIVVKTKSLIRGAWVNHLWRFADNGKTLVLWEN